MTRAVSAGKSRKSRVISEPPLANRRLIPSNVYFNKSWQPWPSLIFLLPLMVFYELGTRLFAVDPVHHTQVRILAFDLIQNFFFFFGVTGRQIPPLAVVGILLAWHIARNDSWKFDPGILFKMGLESILLGLPVILLSLLCARHLPLAHPASTNWREMLVLSVGAGVYEELVFRLIAFTLLAILLLDVMKVRRNVAGPLIVLIPAILFSLYHYLGPEHFSWRSFVFRMLAGAYFGAIFLCRGFGVTAGSHAAYDAMIVILSGLGGG
ncbi:MAG TPA: CPBP family intramembrane glutamic endopeptidase [Tepidisphaeraceae bacterium]